MTVRADIDFLRSGPDRDPQRRPRRGGVAAGARQTHHAGSNAERGVLRCEAPPLRIFGSTNALRISAEALELGGYSADIEGESSND